MRLALVLFLIPGFLVAQLITGTQTIPKGPNPPVVFINGYQANCTDTGLAANFGGADKVLQASGIVSLYFDNCSIGGTGSLRASIEAEGIAFGQFLASLKYADGSAVTQVDVIVHSMGGLILRCYLSGKQDVSPASFAPPATVPVRKAIFIATPHFGSSIASALGSDRQTQAMSLGSQFLFDLNSWNQGFDDLRGIDAISIAGNGGTGTASKTAGFDDGVVALTSSSLGFYRPGVTRIVPHCHTGNSLLSLFGFCASSAPVINDINTNITNPVTQIITSFLTGTAAWKTTGIASESQTTLSGTGGLLLQLRDTSDVPVQIIGANVTNATPNVSVPANAGNIAYAEALSAARTVQISISPLSGSVQTAAVSLASATSSVQIVKPGPVILPRGVIPAAGPAPFPYDVSPGAYVSIYGTNLASSSQIASRPYPAQIGDVHVIVGTTLAQIVSVGSGQINFVYPVVAPGLTQLTVRNANGQHTVNVRVAPTTPSIFLLDANGAAAALNALSGVVVSTTAPLRTGDFLSLYLTGLGATSVRDTLEYATMVPVITIGGQSVPVTYAGRSPGFAGLDQINCQIPAGLTGNALPVVVTSNGRSSNTAFIAIQ